MLCWLGGSARSLRGKRSPSGANRGHPSTGRGWSKKSADVCVSDAFSMLDDGLSGWGGGGGGGGGGVAPAPRAPGLGLAAALAPLPPHAAAATTLAVDAAVTVTVVAPTPVPVPAGVASPPPSPAGRRATKRVAWLPTGRNKDVAHSLDLDAVV